MRYELLCVATISVATSLGCAKKATQAPEKPSPVVAAPAAPTPPPTTTASQNVAVSDDLAARCKLQLTDPGKAPTFGTDEAELLASDRSILQQVADCLVRGPLQGRNVQLTGRADPRGTDEYNLGLGTRRAESVRSYLQRLGVPGGQLSATTRGELDASGTDESGWQRDRRVDLQLVN